MLYDPIKEGDDPQNRNPDFTPNPSLSVCSWEMRVHLCPTTSFLSLFKPLRPSQSLDTQTQKQEKEKVAGSSGGHLDSSLVSALSPTQKAYFLACLESKDSERGMGEPNISTIFQLQQTLLYPPRLSLSPYICLYSPPPYFPPHIHLSRTGASPMQEIFVLVEQQFKIDIPGHSRCLRSHMIMKRRR